MHYDCFIVDDEEAIAQTTSEYFQLFGLSSNYATSYQTCLDFFAAHTASVLLLDINLKQESGFKLCKKIRETLDLPILFISARDSDEDILTALSIGGDDYITKPFSLHILLAKVKAVLKRCHTPALPETIMQIQHIQIDPRRHQIKVNEQPVRLKEMEFKLLLYLVNNPNRVISKDELLAKVWQDTYIGEGTISVHIRRLREKLELNPNQPAMIKTIWGTGYLFEDEPLQ